MPSAIFRSLLIIRRLLRLAQVSGIHHANRALNSEEAEHRLSRNAGCIWLDIWQVRNCARRAAGSSTYWRRMTHCMPCAALSTAVRTRSCCYICQPVVLFCLRYMCCLRLRPFGCSAPVAQLMSPSPCCLLPKGNALLLLATQILNTDANASCVYAFAGLFYATHGWARLSQTSEVP